MSREIYNAFYKKHGADIHHDPLRFIEIANLCKGKVLDVGCGTGDLADFYKGEYEGIDISDVAIEAAQEIRSKNAEFSTVDITEPIKVTAKKYDTIVMAEFLEHIEHDSGVFQNIKDIAAPNARIIISVPNGDRIPDENHLREFTVPALRKKLAPLGKVKFHLWNGFTHRILVSVDIGEKNEELMSLVMMVKDEAKGLERCILSTIEFVDNIVISVDSKTTDKSLAIAKRYADVVKQHEWRNDFAWARNYAQEGVTTKWILSIDGHEFVAKSPKIEEMLKLDVEGLMITMKMESGDTFITPRIFSNKLSWDHAIHNTINPKSIASYTDFLIEHDRKGGQALISTKERVDQVKRTMEKALKKELKIKEYKQRALFYLARYYRQFGEYKKALKYYKKYLKIGRHKGEKWLVCYEAGMLANALGKSLLALKFLRLAEETLPNRWEISKQMGLTYVSFEQYETGIQYLTDSFKINTGKFSYHPEKRDDADTWDKIGYAYFQKKEYVQAKIAWEEAIEKETDEDKIKLNKRRIELLDRNLVF